MSACLTLFTFSLVSTIFLRLRDLMRSSHRFCRVLTLAMVILFGAVWYQARNWFWWVTCNRHSIADGIYSVIFLGTDHRFLSSETCVLLLRRGETQTLLSLLQSMWFLTLLAVCTAMQFGPDPCTHSQFQAQLFWWENPENQQQMRHASVISWGYHNRIWHTEVTKV